MSDQNEAPTLMEKAASFTASLVGSVGGAAAGLLFDGPTGAIIGATAGPVITQVLGDMAQRTLSEREKARIATAMAFAVERIKERIASGEELRKDEFFRKGEKSRSDAEEIFEGTLIRCKQEHEERKTKYVGQIFANAAFSDVSGSEANAILQVAERMSYRQMTLLALIARAEELHVQTSLLRHDAVLKGPLSRRQRDFLLQDLAVLGTSALGLILYLRDDGGMMVSNEGIPYIQGPIGLTPTGAVCSDLLGLGSVGATELKALAAELGIISSKA